MPSTPPPVPELLNRVVAAIGGQRRDGQERMATAVAQAIDSGDHLLVQAGTGTGKSLAYLVPALRHALFGGGRVIVATATLALQRQIMTSDLPAIFDALEDIFPRRPLAAMLKGRGNYLCRHKLAGGYPADDAALFSVEDLAARSVPRVAADAVTPASGDVTLDLGPAGRTAADAVTLAGGSLTTGAGTAKAADGAARAGRLADQVRRLIEWSEQSETGDLDDVPFPVTPRAWRQVSVSGVECLGRDHCPVSGSCFAELARETAATADLVVTNHALLAIDAVGEGTLLPDHDLLIIDEAHELTDRVTSAETLELTTGAVERAARAARRCGAAPAALERAAEALSQALADHPEGRLRHGPGEALAAALELVRSGARETRGLVQKTDQNAGTVQLARAGLDQIVSACDALLGAAEPGDPPAGIAGDRANAADAAPGDMPASDTDGEPAPGATATPVVRQARTPWVVWADRPRRARGEAAGRGGWRDDGGPATLHAAPRDVALLIRDRLLGSATAVLTSATLTVGGGFEAAARAVGLADQADGWTTLDVGSPFDYAKQAILFVARDLPAPGRNGAAPSQTDMLGDLIEAAGGRTLGLFSSRAAAERAAAQLRERLDVPILCQGDEALGALVDRFLADEPTCLFGTLSLWQGIDAPGPTCSLVTIDRLPFPRPDDPISSARQEAAGPAGFMRVAATSAALKLAQGAGRLIRGSADRGVVAVLDPRLVTARYGAYLRASLPPMWPTTDLAVATAALRRLTGGGPATAAG